VKKKQWEESVGAVTKAVEARRRKEWGGGHSKEMWKECAWERQRKEEEGRWWVKGVGKGEVKKKVDRNSVSDQLS
jgi:hypothetical protein